MARRTVLALALAMLICALFAPSAYAGDPYAYDPPAPGAELVSRDTASGAEALRAALGLLETVSVGRDRAIITINDNGAPHPITLDYSELLGDRRAQGVGFAAAAYLMLGFLGRAMRVLRVAPGLLKR